MPMRRILIVEDDVQIALDLEAIISKAIDAEILLSRSVALAKRLIERAVDLALLDVDVTNGKTFEVAAMLSFGKSRSCSCPGRARNKFPLTSATRRSFRSPLKSVL